jgi:hypothetical protein
MKSLSTKMLQISWKMRGSNSRSCNTVEMPASSSKVLQIAGKTDRTADPKKTKRQKQPKQFRSRWEMS